MRLASPRPPPPRASQPKTSTARSATRPQKPEHHPSCGNDPLRVTRGHNNASKQTNKNCALTKPVPGAKNKYVRGRNVLGVYVSTMYPREQVHDNAPTTHISRRLDYDYQTCRPIGFLQQTPAKVDRPQNLVRRALMEAGTALSYARQSSFTQIARKLKSARKFDPQLSTGSRRKSS